MKYKISEPPRQFLKSHLLVVVLLIVLGVVLGAWVAFEIVKRNSDRVFETKAVETPGWLEEK